MVALPGFTKPDKRKGAFGISPLTLLRDKYISDGAKTLYAYLAARGEYDNNTPTRAEIADDLGISETAVTNRCRELVARDWLIVWSALNRGRKAQAYQTFEDTDDCRQFVKANPQIPYVTFKKIDEMIRKPRKGKGGMPSHKPAEADGSTQVDQLKLITPSTQVDPMLNSSSPNAQLKLTIQATQVDPLSAHSLESKNQKNNADQEDTDSNESVAAPKIVFTPKSIFKATTEPPSVAPVSPLPDADPPLPAALIAAWLGERKLPVGVKFASFLRFGKELVEAGVTVEQMQNAAALYYDGWAAGLAVKSDATLAWETGALINTIRRALVVAGNGITAEHMREFMRAKYAEPDGFWTGKVISFTYAAENVAIWLKVRMPAEDVPRTESGQVDIMAYINNKNFGKKDS